MAIILNEAYAVLSDPLSRFSYDKVCFNCSLFVQFWLWKFNLFTFRIQVDVHTVCSEIDRLYVD